MSLSRVPAATTEVGPVGRMLRLIRDLRAMPEAIQVIGVVPAEISVETPEQARATFNAGLARHHAEHAALSQ